MNSDLTMRDALTIYQSLERYLEFLYDKQKELEQKVGKEVLFCKREIAEVEAVRKKIGNLVIL